MRILGALAVIVGEMTSPKLSSSNHTHMPTLSEVPDRDSTQAASPPRGPAPTTKASG